MSDSSAAVHDHLRPGAIVAEKYEVERVLGEGGVGIVVAARHIHLNRPVALKFLKPDVVAAPERAELFANEARATFDIVNAHIVRVLDLDRLDDGTPFMLMELLEGSDLRKWLDAGETFDPASVVDLGNQICSGLFAAHARGVVHRDIKPENIFVMRQEGAARQYKLLDFGISRVSRAGLRPAIDDLLPRVSGTPAYMSPEQVTSESELDQRSDIWSLGCVLYELLARHAPFARDEAAESCRAVLHDQPLPLRAVCPDVDRELERILMRCLSKCAADRFASADELGRALTALQPMAAATSTPSVAVLTPRAGMGAQIPRALGRAASALVGVGLGIAAATYAQSTDRQSEPRVVSPAPASARSSAHVQAKLENLERTQSGRTARPSAAREVNKRKAPVKPLKAARNAQSPDPDVGF